MKAVFEALKIGNVEALQQAVTAGRATGVDADTAEPLRLNAVEAQSGLTAVQLATLLGSVEAIDLLRAAGASLDAQDERGWSALHMAAQQNDIQTVMALLNGGANSLLVDAVGRRALEVTSNPAVFQLLSEWMANQPMDAASLEKATTTMMKQLEAELPDDQHELRAFAIELLLANQMFQDRCKEAIYELLEDKHRALNRCSLLENAAGIWDTATSGDFLAQLQNLQMENEAHVATIGLLKLQNSTWQESVSTLVKHHQSQVDEMATAQEAGLKAVQERFVEAEKKFLAASKEMAVEVAALKRENAALKESVGGSVASSGNDTAVSDVSALRAEISKLEERVKECQMEKLTVVERLKSAEQLKALQEQDIKRVRMSTANLKKMIQAAMTTALEQMGADDDEKDESSGDMVFVRGENGSKQVKEGTLEKLCERLTKPGVIDINKRFQSAFLLTYRSFMTARQLIDILRKRYNDATLKDSKAQSPVQVCVCDVTRAWVERFWWDFAEDTSLYGRLMEFVECIRKVSDKAANELKSVITRKADGSDTRKDRSDEDMPKPKPILPKSLLKRYSGSVDQQIGGQPAHSRSTARFTMSRLRTGEPGEDLKFRLMDIDPEEMARQLTVYEFELFAAIKPYEFLDQAWMKADKEQRAPNICRMTRWTNHVTRWIVTEIVTVKESARARALVVERMVQIAEHCEKLKNFNGCKELMAGLQSSAVFRLKRTREAMSTKYQKKLDELLKLTSSDLNFKNLRNRVHTSDPPLVPFPGVYQGDLVFLDTSSKSRTENGLINFLKYQKIADNIGKLEMYQQKGFNLEMVPEILDYVEKYPALSDDDAYKDSLVCEPRV